ncbi:MAG: ERCC4 domain-containing protein [Clostridia bacterium]
MIIQCDTRQQDSKHKLKEQYFASVGIKCVRSKLFVGDYTRLDNQTICVDSKQDLVEVAGNICGKQHERFRAECLKAKENGIQLIILIEEPQSLETLADWKPPIFKYGKMKGHYVTQVRGTTLAKAMATMTANYGVQFMFTTKQDCGRKIVELLGG